jgi:acetyl-CoA carboxylase, biotin carboxylase subunit
MEMNTRIQVEHPVTELVTGIDMIKEQIRIAAREQLGYSQQDVKFAGHSIKCRINAESPEKFPPSTGKITAFHLAMGVGVRVDTAIYDEWVISSFYDSLIAKIISYGRTRDEAIQRMKRALEMSVIEGVQTTIPLHNMILCDPDFCAGNISTNFLERRGSNP